MVGQTSRAIETTVGGGAIRYPVSVPAGLPVRWYPNGDGMSGRWLVDAEFNRIPQCTPRSIELSDAVHYGIEIAPGEVTECDGKGRAG